MSFTSRQRFFQRSAVHPGHHQDASAPLFLNNGWDQTVAIKLQFFVKAHESNNVKLSDISRVTTKKTHNQWNHANCGGSWREFWSVRNITACILDFAQYVK